jgi:hypothetical protein
MRRVWCSALPAHRSGSNLAGDRGERAERAAGPAGGVAARSILVSGRLRRRVGNARAGGAARGGGGDGRRGRARRLSRVAVLAQLLAAHVGVVQLRVVSTADSVERQRAGGRALVLASRDCRRRCWTRRAAAARSIDAASSARSLCYC